MGMDTSDPRPVVRTGKVGAKQEFKDECDINFIMRKYRTSGQVTHIAQNRGRFADVSEVGTYQDAISRVRDTHSFFMKLSASVRAGFDNDAALFLDWIADPANREDVAKMGLEETLAFEAPEPVTIIPPPEGGTPGKGEGGEDA